MRRDIQNIDKIVERSVKDGSFNSRDDCAAAMRNWLVLGGYIDPSHPPGFSDLQDESSAIEDDAGCLAGISKLEGPRLQYEILRERDA